VKPSRRIASVVWGPGNPSTTTRQNSPRRDQVDPPLAPLPRAEVFARVEVERLGASGAKPGADLVPGVAAAAVAVAMREPSRAGGDLRWPNETASAAVAE
jgi:hypothetical protein